MEGRIAELLAPIAEELGLDVLKVSLGGGHHQQLLKIVVDKAGGVPFDLLARVSRGISLQLDAEDLIENRYRLEVTSPGLDWPLSSEADFRRHEGEMLKVLFTDGSAVTGENLGPCEGGLRLAREDGGEKLVAMSDVAKVVRTIDWKRVNDSK
ncbi:MAG: ribosome assembly cofactor RimP [Zetaproteobacteria bacterium CG06_land_8_20_14_3_00_59_53]|nr:MAG: ribosome assembly cofactor RimP [Zetaproteobacteria bacterium CG2_30_59_37]PIO90409.1 MAG: ribosome assembly cofactor RimP [Zetaproteobacteria bacterium CG23_combo_of_CG06-09_8_20_14_all_59_86]PIQ64747.1 MAG: ribosome assembly cofactor RimP [Zetaproteobacteria bacterium CG11_big_fil_rev_8_21_14_0_20_59_439]PIU71359.1 MAG: ribosome assembly cofactor RimP [Zetaproteobacteria bacterium CG06_land_8_20_14_3_00_59_53]PIU97550.1 MAG: ribosome assembly cofactor RimP [Zetaproteobacteria bacteriu